MYLKVKKRVLQALVKVYHGIYTRKHDKRDLSITKNNEQGSQRYKNVQT